MKWARNRRSLPNLAAKLGVEEGQPTSMSRLSGMESVGEPDIDIDDHPGAGPRAYGAGGRSPLTGHGVLPRRARKKSSSKRTRCLAKAAGWSLTTFDIP